MKILLLSKKFPYPLREGEPIAITNLSRSLHQLGCEMSILVMNTSKHFFDPKDLPVTYDHFQKIHSVRVDNHITPSGAVGSFLQGKSYILSRFQSVEFDKKLVQVLENEHFDIVQIETPYLAHCIPLIHRCSRAKVAMRAHNVEHEIWERVASSTKNPIKKWYLNNQNKHLRRFELARLADYDILVAITDRDLAVFRSLGFNGRSVVAPVGLNLAEYGPSHLVFGSPSLAFIGALDWMPNQDGLVWFLENVWPGLARKFSSLQFHIAGKNTPGWLRKYGSSQVVFHGEVPDSKAFINGHRIFVAPLFSGGGIKIKVLEAMALGRAVVTTGVGLEGIPAKDGKDILRADNAAIFEKKIAELIENEAFAKNVGAAAHQFIQENFDNVEIGKRLLAAYEGLLAEA